jgi:hypothetical protein
MAVTASAFAVELAASPAAAASSVAVRGMTWRFMLT